MLSLRKIIHYWINFNFYGLDLWLILIIIVANIKDPIYPNNKILIWYFCDIEFLPYNQIKISIVSNNYKQFFHKLLYLLYKFSFWKKTRDKYYFFILNFKYNNITMINFPRIIELQFYKKTLWYEYDDISMISNIKSIKKNILSLNIFLLKDTQ